MNEEIHNIDEWEVLTPNGWSDFSGVKKVIKNKYIKIIFDSGNHLICSENHKIKLSDGKFVYASKIKKNDVLSTKDKVLSKQTFSKQIELYDLLNVEKENEYYTNRIVSHNCAYIEAIEEMWIAGYPSLSLGGDAILLSTPDLEGSWFHKKVEKSKKNEFDDDGKSKFVLSEMPWYLRPDFDEKWKEDTLENLSEAEFEREHNCQFGFTGKTAVNQKKLKTNYQEKTLTKEYTENYSGLLKVFNPPTDGIKYVLGCLPPGEKILTNFGPKNVEDIDLNDKLIDENGDFTNIKNKQIYYANNIDIYEIKIDNTYRTTSFTDEHPILVSSPTLYRNYKKNHKTYKFNERYWDFNFKFKKVKDVSVGDWIKVPNIYIREIDNNLDCYWNQLTDNIRYDFLISSPLQNIDFWWFIGYWLGDGWLGNYYKNSYSVSLVFNKQETYYLEKAISIIKKLFDRCPSIIERDTTFTIVFNSKQLYSFIVQNFGQYSYGKKISEWVKYIKKEYKTELLKGYFDSDGCWVKVTKNTKTINSKISYVSINLDLLESIQDILFSIGLISSLHKLRNEKVKIIGKNKSKKQSNTKRCYALNLHNHDSLKLIKLWNDTEDIKLKKFDLNAFDDINKRIISSCHFGESNKFIYFKIKNINKYKFTGNVYNFECDSHTYMAHHITTHNCDVARGDGNDFSTLQILEFPTGKQMAEYKGQLQTEVFASHISEIAHLYNEALVVIENKESGWAVLKDIINICGYKNIYYSKKGAVFNEYINPDNPAYRLSGLIGDDLVPGFTTSNVTRPLILNEFAVAVEHGKIDFYSKDLYSEILTWSWKNGRLDHATGSHDDLIIAYAIGLFIIQKLKTTEKLDDQFNNIADQFMQMNIENRKEQNQLKSIFTQFKRNAEQQYNIVLGHEKSNLYDMFFEHKKKNK